MARACSNKSASSPLTKAKDALKQARRFWPALHEQDPEGLDRFVLSEFRGRFQWYVKQIDFLFMAKDQNFNLSGFSFGPAAAFPPLKGADGAISEALDWFISDANSATVAKAVIRSIFDNPLPHVARYFVCYAFPVFFNHFSTDRHCELAVKFIRNQAFKPVCVRDLTMTLLRCWLPLHEKLLNDFILGTGRLLDELQNSVQESVSTFPRSIQILLLAQCSEETSTQFVHDVLVPSVERWRFAMELRGSPEPAALLAELQRFTAEECHSFCLPFWSALERPESAAVPVPIGDMISQRHDTCYVSYYDIYILDQIWMFVNPLSLLGQEMVEWPFAAFQFYQQRLPRPFQTPTASYSLSESELLQRRYHDELRFEGIDRFELLHSNDESLELLERETKWFHTQLRKLRNRMKSFRQLERDTNAAERFYLAMLQAYPALPSEKCPP
jgi:hypothetical protein